MHYVQIRKNGTLYGIIGPYSDRSDALVDAAALKRPGLDVRVLTEQGDQSPQPRRNYAQAVAALAPIARELAVSFAKSEAAEFRNADRERRIEMIRRYSRVSPLLAIVAQSDEQAGKFADLLANFLPPAK